MRKVTTTYEWTETYAGSTTENEKIIPGIREPGARIERIVLEAVTTDKGVLSGAAVDTAQFKGYPRSQPSAMGGDSWNSFVLQDTYNRNAIPFGLELAQGEDVRLVTRRGSAGSLQWGVRRTVYYAD